MKDDAGKPVRILNPNGFAEWPVRGDERVARVARRVGTGLGDLTRLQTFGIGLLHAGVNIGVIAGVILLLRRGAAGLPRWTPIGVAVVTTFGLLFARKKWVLGRKQDKTRDLLLEEGLCASCGYNLFGVHAGGDARITCPECGAAWRADRIKRAEPFAEGAVMGSGLSILGRHVIGKRLRVRDDAGVSVRIPRGLLREAIRTGAKGSDLNLRLRKARRTAVRKAIPFIVVGLLCCVLITIMAVTSETPSLYIPMVILINGVVGAALIAWMVGQDSPAHRSSMLAQGICPVCAGDISKLEVDASGLRSCSCGSKWKDA